MKKRFLYSVSVLMLTSLLMACGHDKSVDSTNATETSAKNVESTSGHEIPLVEQTPHLDEKPKIGLNNVTVYLKNEYLSGKGVEFKSRGKAYNYYYFDKNGSFISGEVTPKSRIWFVGKYQIDAKTGIVKATYGKRYDITTAEPKTKVTTFQPVDYNYHFKSDGSLDRMVISSGVTVNFTNAIPIVQGHLAYKADIIRTLQALNAKEK